MLKTGYLWTVVQGSFVSSRYDRLFGKDLLIRFSMCVFREHLSICVYASLTFSSEDGMRALISLPMKQSLFYF